MYKTSLTLHSRIAGSMMPSSEPGLFDALGLDLQETGRPWSPVAPPLADITELPTTQPDDTPEVYRFEQSEPLIQERQPVTRSCNLRDDDTVILEEQELLEAVKHAAAIEATSESAIVPEAVTPDTAAPEQATIAEESVTAATATAADSAPMVAPPAIKPSRAPRSTLEPAPIPLTAAAANDYSAAQKPGVLPKRIGSGRLVPARLTWKPRDPFACPSEPKHRRFRWEVMLTSACITAVCGLGCVWILRTLLA